jgi:hypothetical protein
LSAASRERLEAGSETQGGVVGSSVVGGSPPDFTCERSETLPCK